MTARYGLDGLDSRLRPPLRADHDARGNRRRERHVLGPIGEYARPDECEHPVEARVSRDVRPYVARCHDCGAHKTRTGEWVCA